MRRQITTRILFWQRGKISFAFPRPPFAVSHVGLAAVVIVPLSNQKKMSIQEAKIQRLHVLSKMASLVGQVLHICLGLTAGQYDKCFFLLRFVWSVKVNDGYLGYRPNFIFLFFLLILLVPYMLSFIRSSFLRIRGMMPSRPIYKYQPRSQCSLLPALRSERKRKSKSK